MSAINNTTQKPQFNLRSKKVLAAIIILLVLLLLAVAYGISRNRSEAAYAKAIQSVNDQENKRIEYLAKEFQTRARIDRNSETIQKGEKSHAEMVSLLGDNERLVGELYKSLNSMCETNNKDLYSASFPSDTTILLLGSDKKQNLQNIKNAFTKREEGLKEDCNQNKGNEEFEKVSLVLRRGAVDAHFGSKDNYKDVAKIDNLAKFSNGTYVISSYADINKSADPTYETAIKNDIKSYAALYDSVQAAKNNDQEKAQSKYQEYQNASNASAGLYKSAFAAYNAKSKEEQKTSLEIEKNMYPILRSASHSLKDSHYSNGIWTANLLATAIFLYATEHEGKYPNAGSTEELVKIMQDNRYIDDISIDTKVVNYKLINNKDMKIAFSNEVTSKNYDFELVGSE